MTWTAVEREGKARLAGRLGAQTKGKPVMRLFQDSLHERVNARYGLSRGEVGSKATHKQIDRAKGMELKAKILEKEQKALVAGDEAIMRSRGILPSAKARKGRAIRKGLEAEAEKAKREAEQAREAHEAETARLSADLAQARKRAADAEAAREADRVKAEAEQAAAVKRAESPLRELVRSLTEKLEAATKRIKQLKAKRDEWRDKHAQARGEVKKAEARVRAETMRVDARLSELADRAPAQKTGQTGQGPER